MTEDKKEKQLPQPDVRAIVQETIKEHLATLFQDVTAYVDERTSIPDSKSDEDTDMGDDSALSARLKELESQLSQEKEARKAEVQERNRLTFSNKLRDELSAQGITAGTATELLTNRLFPNVSLQDGNFLSKEGKNVTELVSEFVSKEGSDFRNKASGVGTEKGDTPKGSTKTSLESDLQSFLSKW